MSGTQSELGSDISNLDITVVNVSPSILRVTIGASGRYTIPQSDVFQNTDVQGERQHMGVAAAAAVSFQLCCSLVCMCCTERSGTVDALARQLSS